MNLAPGLRPVLQLLALLMTLARPLGAQNVLFVQHDNKPALVVDARGMAPCIEINDKVTEIRGDRYALKPVEEYLPYFIAVRNLEVHSTSEFTDTATSMNNDLHFKADFESAYRLDHVFLLLDLDVEGAGKVFFLHEVGRLDPHDPKPIHMTVPLTSRFGAGHFQFHLFVGGAEVLHSEIPAFEREGVLDRMIAKRVADQSDGGPKPLLGPGPAYPPSLLKAKIEGQAVITLWIRTTGSVRDPVVKSATDPAFGEAALDAARLWRFLPRIKGGRPVEIKVDMPFVFTPPGKSPDKS